MKINTPIILLILLLLASCEPHEEACGLSEEVKSIPIDLKIERLEETLFGARLEEDISFMLERHPEFAEKYLQEGLYPSRDALISTLLEIPKDTLMQELYGEVRKEFPDIGPIETALVNAFKQIKYYYPDFTVPKVYTFVSGFTTDLYIDQEMIVIGLDFFLPADHRFQPPEMPEYIASRYDAEHLVPMIVMAISSRYNQTNLSDNTLLAEMVFYGKAYHFTQAMLPCVPEELVIGYTGDQLAACYSNEEFIWTHLIEQEAIYETNPFEIRKYTGETPFTDVISPDAPGRVGRWIGWNIVDAYAEKNNIDLVDLMAERDARKIFMDSGYKP